MQFVNYQNLPKNIKSIVEDDDYIGYVRVYYRDGYGSRLFFKDAANGTLEKIKKAEERGLKRYTEEIKMALATVCEILFEENNPKGKYDLYDFCEKNDFDKISDGYVGYCYLAHSAFRIVVSKSDDYFCRVYFFDRE